MTDQELWQSILGTMELSVSKAYYNTWLKQTSIVENTSGTIVIGVPSLYHKNWISEKYQATILAALKKIAPEIQRIEYRIGPQNQDNKNNQNSNTQDKRPSQQQNTAPAPDLLNSGLNPTYKFETLIIGKNNELAHAASIAVAKNPGTHYNPLFIYGGVGLGKTHLMQAVGHNFLQANPRANVLYVSCEKFTNDYVNSIKNQRIDEFKRRYRNVEMLLMDDVQFIAGKEQTQEEFFHTFNEIRDRSRQIILTADRQPKDIPGIEQRLISRFEWGMVVDIQPPNFEMRLAILNSKVAKRNAKVDQEVLGYIAEQIQSNVRELEGVLNRLLVYQDMNHCVLNLGQTKEMLENLIGAKKKTLTIKKIASLTAEFYNVTLEDLIKQSRRKEFVTPRQMAMYLSRKELGSSLPVIGDFFGGRDHTTVLHAVEKLEKEITGNKPAKQQVDLLVEKLYNS
jgi:chromosomal replication initiator protein